MQIGDLVWNEYHKILRFGTVTNKTIKENGWAYYTVDWHCDEKYEKACEHREKMCHTNYYIEEYRKDMLYPIAREHLQNIVDCFYGGSKCGNQKCKNQKCKQKGNLRLS